jgi:hypothetical protein
MVTPQQLDSENCSVEGCPEEGRRRYHVKGQPTLCAEHFAAKARANANGSGSNEQRLGLVEQVRKLERLARRLERARRKAQPAVRELKAAQSGTRPSRCSSVAPIAHSLAGLSELPERGRAGVNVPGYYLLDKLEQQRQERAEIMREVEKIRAIASDTTKEDGG